MDLLRFSIVWCFLAILTSGFINDNKNFKIKKPMDKNMVTGLDRVVNEGINKEDLRPKECVPITIPLCKNIGYNLTYMPNEFQQETQEEAGLVVHQFHPLIEIACSKDLQLFLCSMYAPICVPSWPKKIRACRSLCESAKDACLPVMKRYGFKWPKNIDCDKLTEEEACLKRDENPPPRPANQPRGCHCSCRPPFISDNRAQYNSVYTGRVSNCLQSCHHASFINIDKTFVTFWLGLWSILCCCSSTGTLLTFLLDRSRFQYPERPIVFLSGCYAMVSLGFLIRVIMGHESIACDDTNPSSISSMASSAFSSVSGAASSTPANPSQINFGFSGPSASSQRLRYGTTGPARCSIVFLLIYFFGMAASVWWVILSLTWFLSAGLKWGSEAISKYSEIFHFLAWFLPGVKSLLALTFVAIDGDPVSGICYVGNTNKLHLQLFVIVPLTVYLLVGAGFLLAGFVSLIGIRQTIRAKGHAKTDRLEKLMLRIGIFGLLYSIPAAVVIGCNLYELRSRDSWQAQINCICPSLQKSSSSSNANKRIENSFENVAPPEYSIFMLKYFMCLVVGITSGFWIWTSKTLDSWYNAIKRLKSSNNRTSAKEIQPVSPQLPPYPVSQLLHHHQPYQTSEQDTPLCQMTPALSNNITNSNNNNTNTNNNTNNSIAGGSNVAIDPSTMLVVSGHNGYKIPSSLEHFHTNPTVPHLYTTASLTGQQQQQLLSNNGTNLGTLQPHFSDMASVSRV